MILCFQLSMPGVASWNGKWSGEGNLYARVVTLQTKKSKEIGNKILDGSPYSYRWSDGWAASVSVSEVTSAEARKIRKNTAGFSGYDWMIESIKRDQKILSDTDRKVQADKEAAANV